MEVSKVSQQQPPSPSEVKGPYGFIETGLFSLSLSVHRTSMYLTPGQTRLCLAASYSTMPAATPAFKDSTCGECGMAIVSSICEMK